MEKSTPHYDLAAIKTEVRQLGARSFTIAAMNSGKRLGLGLEEMQQTIYALKRRMLYKSMTTYSDHRVWQDVYHTHWHGVEIYVKVTCRANGEPPVISFKEKNS